MFRNNRQKSIIFIGIKSQNFISIFRYLDMYTVIPQTDGGGKIGEETVDLRHS